MGGEPWTEPIEGVTLAQYAAVVAASTEGHPLGEALAWAGVASNAWPVAAPAWRKTLAEGPAALQAHHAELAKAEDRLHRRVPPIEEDAAAWVAFMTCVEKTSNVISLLAGVDLGPNDISRLTRAWTLRTAGDAKLKKQLGELHSRGAAVMPAVRPGPRVPLEPAARPEAEVLPAKQAAPAVSQGDAAPLPAPSPILVPTYLLQVALPPARGLDVDVSTFAKFLGGPERSTTPLLRLMRLELAGELVKHWQLLELTAAIDGDGGSASERALVGEVSAETGAADVLRPAPVPSSGGDKR